MQALAGLLVVDLSVYLPGPYATRELMRLGARVVRLEAPGGDPLRALAPGWHGALNAGKESVVCDLKADRDFGRGLCACADVVVTSFRPGVAERLGVGPDDVPERAVHCALTGFGVDGPYALRAGHDLNYLGWAGVLADTAPSLPPVQVADLAAGALTAVAEILAALIERERTGSGRKIVLSMTHGSHRLGAHRLRGEPIPRFLTGGVACYRIYATVDGRWLTVAALEPKFWRRFVELVELPALADRQWEERLPELEARLAERPLAEWLELFDGEDVSVGPVATLEEASKDFGEPQAHEAAGLGEHTDAWRRELGL